MLKSFSVAALDRARQYLTDTVARTIKLAFGTITAYGETRETDVYFNMCFRDYFASGDRSLSRDVYTSFVLGITIIHEVAHGVFYMRVMYERKMSLQLRHEITNYHSVCEPFFTKDDISLLLPGFDFGPEIGWRLEMYMFGLGFYAQLTSRHGAQDDMHVSMIVSSNRHDPEPTEKESLVTFFKRKKWDEDLVRNLDSGSLSNSPRLHFHEGTEGKFDLLCIPVAALVEQSDGLFFREL